MIVNGIYKLILKMLYALFFRAGKPPPGLHLDVVKGDKLIEVWKCMSLLFSHHTKDFASDSLFHPLSYALFSSNATFVHPEFFFSIKSTWWYNTFRPLISHRHPVFCDFSHLPNEGFNRSWACGPQSNWKPYNLVNSLSEYMKLCGRCKICSNWRRKWMM